MATVTQRISRVEQPHGGYINRNYIGVLQRDDGIVLHDTENINAGLVGLAVEYLTRGLTGTKKEDAFSISLRGARILGYGSDDFDDLEEDEEEDEDDYELSEEEKAQKRLENITGLDEKSIINACKLVGYDVCYRAGRGRYKPVSKINPDTDTIENIATMVKRSLSFWEDYGPIIKSGFTLEEGYTDIIHAGDGDFLTKDTLWDFKVIKAFPKSEYRLQLLVYYIMGLHSIHKEFKNIEYLGIFNPRLNRVYRTYIKNIGPAIIEEVSRDVIGY